MNVLKHFFPDDYQKVKQSLQPKGRSPWWTFFVRFLAYLIILPVAVLAVIGLLLLFIAQYYWRVATYLRLLPHKHRLPIPDLSGG